MRLFTSVAGSRSKKITLIIVVLLVAGVGTWLTLGSHAFDGSPGIYGSIEKDQKQRLNTYRRGQHVNQVKNVDCLRQYAESQITDMAKKGRLVDPSGNALINNISKYCGSFGGQTTAQTSVGGGILTSRGAWSYFFSDGIHNLPFKNKILTSSGQETRRFNRVGIAAYVKWDGSVWVTMVFVKCETGCNSGKWAAGAAYPADPNSTTGTASIAGTTLGEDFFGTNPDGDFVDDSDFTAANAADAETLAVIPFYKYYNASIIDNLYSTNAADAAKTSYGYSYQGCMAQLFNAQAVGTVPLYRYFSSGSNGAFGGDSMYTLSRNDAGYGAYGYGYVGVAGYVFPGQQGGTVPLQSYWASAPKSDHFLTTTAWTNGFLDYSYQSTVGYVYPAQSGNCGPTDPAPPSPNRVPLYYYYSPGQTDNFYTTNWGELGGGAAGYDYHGCSAWLWDRQVPGSIPLYRYYNAIGGDHFYTTNRNDAGYAYYGYTYYEGVVGYTFSDGRIGGTVPLNRYFNGSLTDHFYTEDPWTNGFLGYYFETVEGYAYNHNSYACPH